MFLLTVVEGQFSAGHVEGHNFGFKEFLDTILVVVSSPTTSFD